jgi:ABC-2 type transport system permease protein
MLFFVSLVFSAMGFSLGAMTGRRGLAGAFAGALAFVSYLITNLTPSVDSLKAANRFSPYEYFNKPSILDNGVQMGDVVILVGISVLILAVGFVRFLHRDIAQR